MGGHFANTLTITQSTNTDLHFMDEEISQSASMSFEIAGLSVSQATNRPGSCTSIGSVS